MGKRDGVGEEKEKGIKAREPLFEVELFFDAPKLKILPADVEVDTAEDVAVSGVLKKIPFEVFCLSVLSGK